MWLFGSARDCNLAIVSPPEVRVQVSPVLEASGAVSRGLCVHHTLGLSNVPGTRDEERMMLNIKHRLVLPSITDDPASIVTPDVCAGRGISAGHPTLSTKNGWKSVCKCSNIRQTLHSEENHWLARAEAGTPQSFVWGNRLDNKRSHREIWTGSNPAGLWQLSPGQLPEGGNYRNFHPRLGKRLVVSHGEQSHF